MKAPPAAVKSAAPMWIGVPGVLVAVLIGVTVPAWLAT